SGDLQRPRAFGHPRPPMRWSTPRFTGASMRWGLAVFLFGSITAAHAQIIEINSGASELDCLKQSSFSETEPDTMGAQPLPLVSGLIFASTGLLAQNDDPF